MMAWVVGIVTASNGKGSSEDRGSRSSLSARPHSPPSLQPPNNTRVCELLPSYVSQPHVWPRVQLMSDDGEGRGGGARQHGREGVGGGGARSVEVVEHAAGRRDGEGGARTHIRSGAGPARSCASAAMRDAGYKWTGQL